MSAFNVDEIGKITQGFIRSDKHLAYSPNVMETDSRHILIRAENLFSSLYCQITNDLKLILAWTELQRKLHMQTPNKINKYLVYVIPESVVKNNNLYEELSRAESNEFFFRKVFIDIPDGYDKKLVEGSLRRRIPIWMADREKTLHEYIPLIEDLIPDANLRRLLSSKTAPAIVQELGENSDFKTLFGEAPYSPSGAGTLSSPASIDSRGMPCRIESVELDNFRGFKFLHLNLNADVVVIFGKNGMGKTTIVDALEFAIFNKIERLTYDPDIVTSHKQKYHALINSESSATTEAKIRLGGTTSAKKFEIITQILRHKCTNLVDGKPATTKEVITLLTQNEEVSRKKEYIDILLHTHFLGQHSIRYFIYGSGEKGEDVTRDRYDLISEMFGLGKIESLRRRVEQVCNDIRRDKINVAEQVINQLKTSLRSTQHKYGPRTHEQMTKKGYDIDTSHTVALYHHFVDELRTATNVELDLALIHCDLPVSNFVGACESIAGRLDREIKRIKARESDLDRLVKLRVKLESVLRNANVKLELDSPVDYVVKFRTILQSSMKSLEDHRHACNLLRARISTLSTNQRILGQFRANFSEYQSLKATERTQSQHLQNLRETNSRLTKQKVEAERRLQKASKEKRELEREIEILQGLLISISTLREKHGDLEFKRRRLAENQSKITEIDRVLAESDERTLQISHSHPRSESTQQFLEKEDYFLIQNQVSCPCCGTVFQQKRDLNGRIAKEAIEGRYKDELVAFLASIGKNYEKQAVEATRKLLAIRRSERKAFENENNGIVKEIQEYEGLLARVCGKKSASELELSTLREETQVKLMAKRELIQKYDLASVEAQIQHLNEEATALNVISNERACEVTKNRLSGIERNVKNLLTTEKEMEDPLIVNERLALCTSDLAECTRDLAKLEKEISEKTILQERSDELANDIAEIESLISKLKIVDDPAILRAPDVARNGGASQRQYFEMLEKANDLAVLFGLIGVQEESDRVQVEIRKEEQKKAEWTRCYDHLKDLSDRLSRSSKAGLERNLEQYSPLINEIYKKFTRHELFSEVQLKPQTSTGRRKRSLYILLRNYSGGIDYTPASYLSEAQLNILALSIFLTRVIYQNMSSLQTVLIDDPIQQMDDMNATSFIDIVIGLSQAGKQLVITTCNADFFELVRQKMSQVTPSNGRKFLAIDLEALPRGEKEPRQLPN